MKLRIGYVVKMKDGRIGMITWRKSNEEIGINFNHYHIIENVLGKDKTPQQRKEWIVAMGADDIFSISEIESVVNVN